MLVSRDPGLFFCVLCLVLMYLCTYGLRPLTSWRFTHTRPRGNQRLFPLGTPSRPATFSNSEKVAMGIDPAFNFACSLLRPYSKMLTLPMVHPVPRKLAGHPWPAHVIFFNVLKFRVESVHFQVKKTNSFLPLSVFQPLCKRFQSAFSIKLDKQSYYYPINFAS
ncbi:MAG: hypothetical protein ACJAT8_001531 [Cellvibrionaceae bacterium]|jgi:hypothetical protein